MLDLETRIYVLEIALTVENLINNLVLHYLNVTTEQRRAFTNKSGGMSFKNKIDLLFDLDILKKKGYEELLLIMEFRNQFMHNYNCNTFTDAISFLGNDKKNKLLKFIPDEYKTEDEEKSLKLSYDALFIEATKTVTGAYGYKAQIEKENNEFLTSLTSAFLSLYDLQINVFLLNTTEGSNPNNSELTSFRNKLTKLLDDYKNSENSAITFFSKFDAAQIIKSEQEYSVVYHKLSSLPFVASQSCLH